MNIEEKDMSLPYYFDELQPFLVKYGTYNTVEDALKEYRYDSFLEQYRIAVLDICLLVIA